MAKERLRVLEAEEKRPISILLQTTHDGDAQRHWRLAAPESEDSAIDFQIDWVFRRLSPDPEVWSQLAANYRVDVFTGLFLERSNGGVELSPASMRLLSERGIPLGFDIYFDPPQEDAK